MPGLAPRGLPSVLVADADRAYLQGLAASLGRWYMVWTAYTVEQAAHLIDECSPQALLLEFTMPGARAFEASLRLGRRAAPALLLTAWCQHPRLEAALPGRSQPRAFIYKPCQPATLRQAIEDAREDLWPGSTSATTTKTTSSCSWTI